MPTYCDRLTPNFLLLGAQKCGTTWLANVLARQPGVFLPPKKELHYFTRYYERGSLWYCDQFAAGVAAGASAIGEATPNYFAVNLDEYAYAAERIAAHRPDMKFILILRNPVERAISAYSHHIVRGRFDPFNGFDKHIHEILSRRRPGFGIIEFGEYGRQLAIYLRLFRQKQFMVLIYEEMILRKPDEVIVEVLAFLGLEPTTPVGPLNIRHNVSVRGRRAARFGSAISVWMRSDEARMRYGGLTTRLAQLVDGVVGGPRIEPTKELRQLLVEHFQEDVAYLGALLGRFKPIWPEFRTNLDQLEPKGD